MEDFRSEHTGNELDDAIKEINKIAKVEDIKNINNTIRVLIKCSDGTYAKVSPEVLKSLTSQYITKKEYLDLISQGAIDDNMEYNIIEDE